MPAEFEDILYQVDGPIATVTFNRPKRYNAFRSLTVDELISAFNLAWADRSVRCVILTGAGDKAFCAGGDVKQRAETGDDGPSEMGFIRVEEFHRQMRDMPKPTIAAVNGFAIGGGHVFQVLCDLSIAAEHAVFGQVGPRVGSFDGGFGAPILRGSSARSGHARSGISAASTMRRRLRSGDWSTRWSLETGSWTKRVPGDSSSPRRARRRCVSSSTRSMPTASIRPESRTFPAPCRFVLRHGRGARGRHRVRREARA